MIGNDDYSAMWLPGPYTVSLPDNVGFHNQDIITPLTFSLTCGSNQLLCTVLQFCITGYHLNHCFLALSSIL